MKTDYKCPICKSHLILREGGKIRKDGVTLYCDNDVCSCPEVFGYEKNEASAYKIIIDKYKP